MLKTSRKYCLVSYRSYIQEINDLNFFLSKDWLFWNSRTAVKIENLYTCKKRKTPLLATP